MYNPGDEIGGSVVVKKVNQGRYIMRCDCQCTFVVHVKKLMHVQVDNDRLNCHSCEIANPRPRTLTPARKAALYSSIGKAKAKNRPCERVLFAFRLRYREGWTIGEIANVLSVSVQTVHAYFLRWNGRIEEYKGMEYDPSCRA